MIRSKRQNNIRRLKTMTEKTMTQGLEDRLPYLLTAQQVCEVLQISRMTLLRVEKAGKIKSTIVGRKCKRFHIPDIEEYIKASRT